MRKNPSNQGWKVRNEKVAKIKRKKKKEKLSKK
jgi:hypothetical protein